MNILCALFTLTYLTRSSSPAQFLLITRGCLTSNQNQITFLDIFLPIRKCPVRWRNEWRYSLIYDFKNWSARNWTYLKLMGSQGASCFYIPPAADGMKWEFLNHAHPQRPRWSGGCFFYRYAVFHHPALEPMMARTTFLTVLICLCHIPPMWHALRGSNVHSIWMLHYASCKRSSSFQPL